MKGTNKPPHTEEIKKAAQASGITEEQATKFIAELTKKGVPLPVRELKLSGVFC